MSPACHFFSIGKSFSQKSLLSTKVYPLCCNFIACNFTKRELRNRHFFGNFVEFSEEMFFRIYMNSYVGIILSLMRTRFH